MTIFRTIVVSAALGAALPAVAAEPLNPPAALVPPSAAASPGAGAVTLAAAQRAQELGLASVATGLYRELLTAPGADRAGLSLALATVLLESGRPADAEQVLAGVPEPRGSAWQLRAGLVAAQTKKADAMRPALAAIRETELTPADRAWHLFLQGMAFDLAAPRDRTKANEFYSRAEAAATNDLARARFRLAGERVRLEQVAYSEAEVEAARKNYEGLQGRDIGYRFGLDYAVMRAASGGRAEAVRFLQGVLVTMPVAEREWTDRYRLLLGMIGDTGRNGAGRNALHQLLENGNSADQQREALQLLARESQDEALRGLLRAELDKLVAMTPKHRIFESLLFYRAQVALTEKKFATAEDDAKRLLEDYPGSPLKVHALGVRAASAWEQQRYRFAANQAREARGELAAGEARAELGLLEAEAWFRAGLKDEDRNAFRNAADAYAAVLRERPANVKPGDLIFQRVLAEIKAGALAAAAKVIDEFAGDGDFDAESRWQAEWSLARAAQLGGPDGVKQAFARVNALLTAPRPAGEAVKPDLRVRMEWLQARLALEAGQERDTLRLVDDLLKRLGDVEPALRDEVASTALLRKAEAQFRLGSEADALKTLQQVRANYPKSEAAIQSFVIESEHYADSDQIQKAMNGLTSLTDNAEYAKSRFIPYAYYRLALLAERLGQKKDFEAANAYIEKLVKSADAAAQPDLVFVARLKQGELLRRLNQFPQAQFVYDTLTTTPASTENAIMARLELAKCHNAQASIDASHVEKAQLLFEELCDRVDASADVRVEAGYYLGALLAGRGKSDQAAKVWWNDVIGQFLIDEKAPAFESGAKRPYWLARTLLDLGALLEQQRKLEDARNALGLIRLKKLGYGEGLAEKALERLGVPPPAR